MTDTSSEALDRVLALAEKATPGPWTPADFGYTGIYYGPFENAAYVAAAYPAFVASLIREVQRLREATTPRSMGSAPLDGTRVLVRCHVERMDYMTAWHVCAYYRRRWYCAGRPVMNPTAWMPLPSTEETP